VPRPVSGWLGSIVLVAVGGAVGGIARYWVSGFVAQRFGETFPWGTLVVNVTGAAAIGGLAALLLPTDADASLAMPLWTLLAIGILGSYTTVSSFSLQTLALLRSGERGHAVANFIGSVAACLSVATASYLAVLTALGRF
jgi:fluoride exporter